MSISNKIIIKLKIILIFLSSPLSAMVPNYKIASSEFIPSFFKVQKVAKAFSLIANKNMAGITKYIECLDKIELSQLLSKFDYESWATLDNYSRALEPHTSLLLSLIQKYNNNMPLVETHAKKILGEEQFNKLRKMGNDLATFQRQHIANMEPGKLYYYSLIIQNLEKKPDYGYESQWEKAWDMRWKQDLDKKIRRSQQK